MDRTDCLMDVQHLSTTGTPCVPATITLHATAQERAATEENPDAGVIPEIVANRMLARMVRGQPAEEARIRSRAKVVATWIRSSMVPAVVHDRHREKTMTRDLVVAKSRDYGMFSVSHGKKIRRSSELEAVQYHTRLCLSTTSSPPPENEVKIPIRGARSVAGLALRR